MDTVDHVYAIEIKASPDRVWRAITDGDDTVRYYFDTRVASDWTPGSPLVYTYADGSVAADGVVIEVDAGRRVVMDFRPRWDPSAPDMDPVRMTWLVEAGAAPGTTMLTVTSALVPGSPIEADFTSGIVHIVSGLKTLLETGAPLVARLIAPAQRHRGTAAGLSLGSAACCAWGDHSGDRPVAAPTIGACHGRDASCGRPSHPRSVHRTTGSSPGRPPLPGMVV